jgi:hypothetical protein
VATVYDIEKTLNSALVAYGNAEGSTVALANIVWANTNYTPVIGTAYIDVAFVPATSASVGIGADTQNREIGFYQLMIHVPSGEGKAVVVSIVEEIKEYFKRGTVIAYGSVSVRCTRFQILPTVSSPDWFTQFIRIEWRADINN